jgi:hypothetical protein
MGLRRRDDPHPGARHPECDAQASAETVPAYDFEALRQEGSRQDFPGEAGLRRQDDSSKVECEERGQASTDYEDDHQTNSCGQEICDREAGDKEGRSKSEGNCCTEDVHQKGRPESLGKQDLRPQANGEKNRRSQDDGAQDNTS